ncbi:MAG: tryptophan--tRNA ligase [Dialister micraerophilus]|uniref:Tryptophan--tRNA ligase n=2 Tax=Dialister micraerophilus TaxID=309120 RepID=E4LAE7_9FIRM|nr:tryptophan--tRNA ligase [Dialister micraerophilus]EFR42222.1 tryptophan--tRNA ligase [Dialister micraerophilus UPII 345-E]MDK8285295.1 tryptophan--tRNA ligase [Dialister micraerophilus]MDU5301514.1 tryptophan--tRNA ligase [Dialister micraerophilus]
MDVIFSGIQPSGSLTLGNYLGALKNFIPFQETAECYYCIVNQHAITVPQDPKLLHSRTRDLAALYIAAGMDPKKSTIFVQSEVPEHALLGWMMICSAYVGEMERMTQYKSKAQKQEKKGGFIPLGLLTYPPLMAADILLYQTNLVPVGADQRQHMEITRDLAERFNHKYGEVFTIPEMWEPKGGARVMSLQEPTSKMSKSDENEWATIHMLDEADTIVKKIKRAVTDSLGHVHYDKEKQPGIANLMSIHSAISKKSYEEIEKMYEGQGYGTFKKDVADLVVGEMQPILDRYKELKGSPELDAILDEGREKAHKKANATYVKAIEAMGLYRK